MTRQPSLSNCSRMMSGLGLLRSRPAHLIFLFLRELERHDAESTLAEGLRVDELGENGKAIRAECLGGP